MTHHYTYYSYEEWGRGYFGSRSCDCLPEEDVKYLGSFKDKNFKPTQKIILKDDYETRAEAIEDEVILHNYYDVAANPHFANRSKQTTSKFTTSGMKMTEEQRKKMGDKLRGRKLSKEHIQKVSAANMGRKHTPEARKRMSEGQKRRSFEGEGNPFYGKEHSQETKELLKQRTTETWKNQPHPWIGRKHSEESKAKFRENNKGEGNPNYGKKLWNNGEKQKFSKECPGEGWVLGSLKNK